MKKIIGILQRYDRLLSVKGRLNGEKVIIRQSPFSKLRQHDIYTFRNQFIGPWLIRKIMMMDSQRHDFVGSTLQHNADIKNSANKNDRAMHRDVAKFMRENDKIVI